MAIDEKESGALKTEVAPQEAPRQPETLPPQEAMRSPESPARESGDVLESGRTAGGNERLGRLEAPLAGASYAPVADEAYVKYKQIEKVLEEDLGEIYNNLTPREQKAFKVKGEETARSIFQLVYHQTRIRVKKIVKLIRNWLKAVPGINKFFLEQEAKIKADRIVSLAGEEKKVEF